MHDTFESDDVSGFVKLFVSGEEAFRRTVSSLQMSHGSGGGPADLQPAFARHVRRCRGYRRQGTLQPSSLIGPCGRRSLAVVEAIPITEDPDYLVLCPSLAQVSARLFVAFVCFCSRLVCTRQDQPGDSVNQLHLMEIEQQPQRNVQHYRRHDPVHLNGVAEEAHRRDCQVR